ncbi:MAG: glycogen synthase [Actinobacteria bacterium]|nr:glycogen synthase [Actinomycetota bacterium]MBI3687975.1 glycogen synthase [Actinomycetota bacterium]
MKVALLTREFPPDVYGGAGVHVDFLVRELRRLVDVDVHCFGEPRPGAHAHRPPDTLAGANLALRTLAVDLEMADRVGGNDVVHSHTWYANLAGQLAAQLHDVPHVLTAHSLEPRRPWKSEQLRGGYQISSWVERSAYERADAVIAVSEGMRRDVLEVYPFVDPDRVHVVHNGIDVAVYRPTPDHGTLARYGIDPDRPTVVFIGRITRQKGLPHLLRAARQLVPDAQLVLCASEPDTPEIATEVAGAVGELRRTRSGVVWITDTLPRDELLQILSHATAFTCPSIYEPLGIVNLEAMACEVPVVASAVGGIPEVVADGVTGLLVPYDAADPDAFEAGLARSLNELIKDRSGADAMGRAGRDRVTREFAWDRVAERTVEIYRSLR